MFGNYSGLLDTTVGNNAAGNPVRNDISGVNVPASKFAKPIV